MKCMIWPGVAAALLALCGTCAADVTLAPLFQHNLVLQQQAAAPVWGRDVHLEFDHIGGGLVSKGLPLAGFAVAGEDRVFHVAQARIVGRQVVLDSGQVDKPVAARYAWASNPVCNLYNQAGLPAVPFRTDDWKRETIKAAPGEQVVEPKD